MKIRQRLQMMMGGKKAAVALSYLFRDLFTTPAAVDNVNGTAAEPGVGTRVVGDASHNITIHDNLLGFANGAANWTGTYIYEAAVTRAAGRTIFHKMMFSAATKIMTMGFLQNTSVAQGYMNALSTNASGTLSINRYDGESINLYLTGEPYAAGAWTYFATVLRASGAFFLMRVQNRWKIISSSSLGTTATLYPFVQSNNAAGQCGKILVADAGAIKPVVSDGFSSISASDGLGHPEGGDGAGVVGLALSGAWQVSGGVANATSLTGGVGLFGYLLNTPDVFLTCTLTRSAGNVGVMLRGIGNSNNYVTIFHDGTRWKMYCYYATGNTWLVQTGSIAIGNGKIKVSICSRDNGSSLFYVEYPSGAIQSIIFWKGESSGGLYAGLYTTDTGNTFDDLVIYPIGRQDQYKNLDQYLGLDSTWRSSEKFIVFDGDSLSAGSGTDKALTYAGTCLDTLGSPYAGITIAIGGRNSNGMLSETGSMAPAYWYDSRRAKNIVVYWEDYNGCKAGFSGATSYANFVSWATPLKAQGFQVVILTQHLTGDLTGPQATARNDYNALIVTNSFGADAIVRIDQNAYIGDAGNPNNTTYYNADKVHLVAAGYAIVAGLVTTAIQGLG